MNEPRNDLNTVKGFTIAEIKEALKEDIPEINNNRLALEKMLSITDLDEMSYNEQSTIFSKFKTEVE
jgi:hypothetical protein